MSWASLGMLAATATTLGSALVVAWSDQQTPRFTTRLDLVRLDVSVLENRRPVRGLAATDFTILEDGVPQAVATFAPVAFPDAIVPSTHWMRDVVPDVRRNDTVNDRRLFIIVLDDSTAELNTAAMRSAKVIARQVIDRLGPNDLAAILFTLNNKHAQDYTSDRRRLLAAVEHFNLGFRGMTPPMSALPDVDEFYYRSSVDTLRSIAEALIALPQQRKTLVYIGQGVPVDPVVASEVQMIGEGRAIEVGRSTMHQVLMRRIQMLFEAARRANVNVYAFDTCGLRVAMPEPPPATCRPGVEQRYLEAIAEGTGGRAAIDINDQSRQVEQMFEENRSYYLLGYVPNNRRRDGRYRRIEVRVNRPGVEVRSRSGYHEPNADVERRQEERTIAQPLRTAISGLLPKPDVPLQVWAAPFAGVRRLDADVALTLAVRAPVGENERPSMETVDIGIEAFSPDGRPRGRKSVRADISLQPGPEGHIGYEVRSSLRLTPGRYQLRISAHLRRTGSSGSVYYDVNVPRFSSTDLLVSDIALSARPAPPSGSPEPPLLPVAATTLRSFGKSGSVAAFGRVYQRRPRVPRALALRWRILDEANREVWTRVGSIGPEQFKAGQADITCDLPLASLEPGAYLLVVEILTAEGTSPALNTSSRLRFGVQ